MAAITVTSIFPKGSDATAITNKYPSVKSQRGIRGASGGVYVGPVISKAATEGPATPTHATTAQTGGIEDSTGHRESDTYDVTGATGGITGSGAATVTTVTRPTGRTAYIADGVQGGSVPGRPTATGTDHIGGGGGTYDKRNTIAGTGGHYVGQSKGTNVDGETVTQIIPRPTLGTAADPAAGTVALVSGALKLQVDLHADDITGGANGRKGAEIALFPRRTDTDEDGDLIKLISVDASAAPDITDAFTGLTASTTYAFYARFRKADNNGKVVVGPWSLRGTVATS